MQRAQRDGDCRKELVERARGRAQGDEEGKTHRGVLERADDLPQGLGVRRGVEPAGNGGGQCADVGDAVVEDPDQLGSPARAGEARKGGELVGALGQAVDDGDQVVQCGGERGLCHAVSVPDDETEWPASTRARQAPSEVRATTAVPSGRR